MSAPLLAEDDSTHLRRRDPILFSEVLLEGAKACTLSHLSHMFSCEL